MIALSVGTPLFISPPNSTPYSQACDKQDFNGTFGSELEESYAEWAEVRVMGRKKQGPVPTPSREEVATWVLHAFNSISDDAIRKACSRAFFPNGLKLSELEDEEYFRSQGKRPFDPPSESDSVSETDTDSSSSSDSSSSDDPDSDSDDDCDIFGARAGRGVWGLCHSFDDKLYLTRDLMVDNFVPKDLPVPKVNNVPPTDPRKKAAKPGEHVQLFKMRRDRKKGGVYSEHAKQFSMLRASTPL